MPVNFIIKYPVEIFVLDTPNNQIEYENKLNNTHHLSHTCFEILKLKHLKYKGLKLIVLYYLVLKKLKFLKNEVYITYYIVDGKLGAYAICHSKYYKFPFMDNNDYQIGCVFTFPKFRRMGLSSIILKEAIKRMHCKMIWYITYTNNIASKTLCAALGFKFYSLGNKETKIFNPLNAKYIPTKTK